MAYQRKTRDEYRLWADYGYGQGFELETTEETRADVREQLACYRENAPRYSYRITGPHRVPLNA